MPCGWRTDVIAEYVFWPGDRLITNPEAERELADEFGLAPHECAVCTLRTLTHKYVHFASERLPPLLFDLETDPEELHNLLMTLAML